MSHAPGSKRPNRPLPAAPLLVMAGLLLTAGLACAGCGSMERPPPAAALPAALVREARSIGRGPRFQPPAKGPIVGPCRRELGPRSGVHVELFAANQVVLVASGLGTRPPRAYSEGRISKARCYGDLVTLEPTGVVLVRPGARLHLSDLFRAWGQPLSSRSLATFSAPPGKAVRVFVDGQRWRGEPGSVRLMRHSEIVLEVGPFVPPHSRYTFPPGA
jgi:hypothetical protein